ncbi:DUF4314 domain-containing protein [Streptomyces sp. NRRL S-350]|uniref:DUF4314 domain-containing protein n=1 Tax=Streptomyces sp. NRRL S-350 TaxID=1463902 RepID=UPI0004BEC90F|nr:DUF4314 domain-containing protein [Streptomyces sp. NRRL S-350]
MYAHLHPGTRVRLIRMTDLHTDLRPGAEGSVTGWHDVSGLAVDWDSGSKLSVLPDAGDRVEVI